MKKVLSILLLLTFLTFWSHAQTLVPYNCGDKWGYADETGKRVLPCRYLEAGEFVNGKAVVQTTEGYLVIDEKGKVIIERGREELLQRFSPKYILTVTVNNEASFIDLTTGKEYPFTGDKKNTEFVFLVENDRAWFLERQAGFLYLSVWDIISREWIIRHAQVVYNTFFIIDEREEKFVTHLRRQGWVLLKKDGKMGLWSIKEGELVPFNYEKISVDPFEDDKFPTQFLKVYNQGKMGIWSIPLKKEITPCVYVPSLRPLYSSLSNKLFALQRKEPSGATKIRVAYIDIGSPNEIHVGNAEFDDLVDKFDLEALTYLKSPVNNGLLAVKVADKVGCINLKGDWVVPPNYDEVITARWDYRGPLLVPVRKGKKWGAYSAWQKKEVLPAEYDMVGPPCNGYLTARDFYVDPKAWKRFDIWKHKKWGGNILFDSLGKELYRAPESILIMPFSDSLLLWTYKMPKTGMKRDEYLSWYFMNWHTNEKKPSPSFFVYSNFPLNDLTNTPFCDAISKQYGLFVSKWLYGEEQYKDYETDGINFVNRNGEFALPWLLGAKGIKDVKDNILITEPSNYVLSPMKWTVGYIVDLSLKKVLYSVDSSTAYLPNKILSNRFVEMSNTNSYPSKVNVYDLKRRKLVFKEEEASKIKQLEIIADGYLITFPEKGEGKLFGLLADEPALIGSIYSRDDFKLFYKPVKNLLHDGIPVLLYLRKKAFINAKGEQLLSLQDDVKELYRWDPEDVWASIGKDTVHWGVSERGIIIDPIKNLTVFDYPLYADINLNFIKTKGAYHLINTRTGKVVYSSEYPIYPTPYEKIYRVTYKGKDGRDHTGYIHLNGTRYWKE